MKEEIEVEMKQLWKRKRDGLLVRVTGLIFLEPKRVMWQALKDEAGAHEITTEREFKKQYEYQPQKLVGES